MNVKVKVGVTLDSVLKSVIISPSRLGSYSGWLSMLCQTDLIGKKNMSRPSCRYFNVKFVIF